MTEMEEICKKIDAIVREYGYDYVESIMLVKDLGVVNSTTTHNRGYYRPKHR